MRRKTKPKTKTKPRTKGKASKAPAPPVEPTFATGAARRALIRRFFNTIDRKLQQLEISMSNNEDLSPADHERETRIIGTLIRNVEKVNDLDRSNVTAPEPGAKPDGGAIDQEQLFRELAERIQRLRERRTE